MSNPLGDFEQLLLFAVLRLGGAGSGAAIREEISARTGRSISPGALYTAMTRLEVRGFVSGEIGGPTPTRGGRRKKFYRIEPKGAEALQSAYDQLANMADGIVPELRRLAHKGSA